MDDKHAEIVIKGLLGELKKSWEFAAAQKSVISQYVGDSWDTEIADRQKLLKISPDDLERLFDLVTLGAPESNPLEGWEAVVRRLLDD